MRKFKSSYSNDDRQQVSLSYVTDKRKDILISFKQYLRYREICWKNFVRSVGQVFWPWTLSVNTRSERFKKDRWRSRSALVKHGKRGIEERWRTYPFGLSLPFSDLKRLKGAFRIRTVGPWFMASNTTNVTLVVSSTFLITLEWVLRMRIDANSDAKTCLPKIFISFKHKDLYSQQGSTSDSITMALNLFVYYISFRICAIL